MTLTMLPGLRGHDGGEGARNYELLEGKTHPGREGLRKQVRPELSLGAGSLSGEKS